MNIPPLVNDFPMMTTLDIAGSYPTGLMAALGSVYNDPQLLINAQLRYTAAQVDITAQQDASYSQQNLEMRNTATLAAISLKTQIAATTYKNASHQVNYANQILSDKMSAAYTNAYTVYKVTRDASYTAYLLNEASTVLKDKVAAANIVVSVGMSSPNINTIDITTLSTMSTMVGNVKAAAHLAVSLAHTNATNYLLKTQSLLGNAIIKSTLVTNRLTLIATFNNLLKTVLKNIADPLNHIAGKGLLDTQYVPGIPLSNAIQVANYAKATLHGIISAIGASVPTNSQITNNISTISTLANSLDNIARENDVNMYLTGATANQLINTASTMKAYGMVISIPSEYPFDQYRVNTPAIQIATMAKRIALLADASAVNARLVSDALIALANAYEDATTAVQIVLNSQTELSAGGWMPNSFLKIAMSSLDILNEALLSVNNVVSNSSAHSAISITTRASNTINGLLAKISVEVSETLNEASDAKDILTLLNTAISKATVTDAAVTQELLWSVNAALGRADEISEKLKEKSFTLSRTAHNSVTPQSIAIQTATANTAGQMNNNMLSRLDRNSRNPPVIPPKPYTSFQATTRATKFQHLRPSLDELVYKNRITPLRPDSLRTVLDTKIKVAQEVQEIKDKSGFSFRQQ
jgi:hypothetical protein